MVDDSSGPGRREARERTVQILYEADTRAIDPTEVLAELQVEPDPFAVDLVTGVAANISMKNNGGSVHVPDLVTGIPAANWTDMKE